MLTIAGTVAAACLALACACCLWRLVRGPTSLDRVLALDTLVMNCAALVVVFTIVHGREELFELVFVISLLGLVSTLSLARFIETGRFGSDPFEEEGDG